MALRFDRHFASAIENAGRHRRDADPSGFHPENFMHLRKLALALLLIAASGTAAQAQLRSAPLELQTFRPAMDSKGFITLNASQILGPKDFSFGLVTTYARSLLS